MKIAMGQLNVKAGRPLENIAAMKVMIQKAKEDQVICWQINGWIMTGVRV